MKKFDVVSVSLNLTPLDWTGNRQRISNVLQQIKSMLNNDLPKIICLPELSVSGPGCDDMFLSQVTSEKSLEILLQFLPETDHNVLALGLPFSFEGQLYKSTVLVADQKILGIYCSSFLETQGIHYDMRWFSAWPNQSVKQVQLSGQRYPIGDISFLWNDLRIAIVPHLLAENSSDQNNVLQKSASFSKKTPCDLILCPTASPFELGQQQKLRDIILKQSQTFDCPVVYSTLLGIEAGSLVYDGGSMIASDSRLFQCRRFSYRDSCFVSTQFALNENHRLILSKQEPTFSNNLFYSSSNSSDKNENQSEQVALEKWETSEDVLFEEFAKSVALGLYGYLKKCRSNGFVLSLSGGADSASIAILIAFMIESGISELGMKTFLKQFAFIPCVSDIYRRLFLHDNAPILDQKDSAPLFEDSSELTPLPHNHSGSTLSEDCHFRKQNHFRKQSNNGADSKEPRDFFYSNEELRTIVAAFLTTVYQATKNSSEITRQASQEIANFIGSKHYEFDIDPVVELYKRIVSEKLERQLDWQTDDLALQNIQARTRSPSVWLLANVLGGLLLSTGNRSEVACGYATMDGDTSGSLSPIAGIDKAFLRNWLKWLEKQGLSFPSQFNHSKRWAVPALKFINEQQPTAELRPLKDKQTDETDLMPYCVLDLFEKAIIRDKKDCDSVLDFVSTQLKTQNQTFEKKQLIQWQIRFYQLWAHSQWKRHRFASGFHLDQYDLAPNSCCRFPIFSGGFQNEIESLQTRLKTLQ
ncbi:MAG: NAD(+) synthase [Planctomycetia bacterium]|nr:NAD(+) synthase [Planctomycetia bacterium]